MSDQSNPNNTDTKPAKTGSGKRLLLKLIFWFVVVCGLGLYLQSLGPITINGISLTVPVSE